MTGLAAHLLGLDDADRASFFTDTKAVEISRRIGETTDAELKRLVADDGVRRHAVGAMLSRFEEFADHERLAAIDGVVCFDLVRASGLNECHTVRFHGGAVDLLDGGARPDVTIGAAIVDFVRLVTGQRNAALLYLADRVVLTGDEMLALAVGTVFRVPGTDRAAVDPTALDAMDVASAVASTSREHMGEVMANGFRGIVLGEVFRRFPDFLDPERASRLKLSVGFRIGGPRDTEPDRYVVHIDHGACRIEEGVHEGGSREATICLDGVDFLRLATGQLNPVRGVLTGTTKVRGDKAKALALNAIMQPPRARP